AHDRAEDAAGPKVDLAVDGLPRRGGEPLLQLLGLRPGPPDFFRRHVHYALQHEVELWIVAVGHGGMTHVSVSLSSVRYRSSWSRRVCHSERCLAIQCSAAFSGFGASR